MVRTALALVTTCWLAVPSLADEAAPKASVGTTGLNLRRIDRGSQAGKQSAEQSFTFDLGRRYRVKYRVVVDPAQPDKVATGEGAVGLPTPCSCNWYHSGFLFVRINGKSIGKVRLRDGYVCETGQRAIADLVWDTPEAAVRLRFAGLPRDDKLFCEIAIDPKVEVKELAIKLRCYPSFFTAHHKRKGDRKIKTPAATFNQGQNVKLPAAEHWYGAYYDTIFDVAKGEGEGPCAMMFVPEPVKELRFNVGSYAVDTNLICKPDARTVRLALWEFPKVVNADVLAAFDKQADAWQQQLKTLDFTPTIVSTFDAKAELAALAKLAAPAEVRKKLGAKADEYRKRIEAIAASGDTPGILQQTDLLTFVAAYREFVWELKLAGLLVE